jgi:hypothetical protein
MNVFRKRTTRYVDAHGKRVAPDTPNAKRHVIPSKHWYGTLRTADGKRRQVPLSVDRKASTLLLRRLQTEADTERALGVNVYARERQRPLTALVDEYETFLHAKADTSRHVTLTLRRLRLLVDATKAKTLADVDASRIASTLASWRQRERKPLSIATSNHYAQAIRGFSRYDPCAAPTTSACAPTCCMPERARPATRKAA